METGVLSANLRERKISANNAEGNKTQREQRVDKQNYCKIKNNGNCNLIRKVYPVSFEKIFLEVSGAFQI